MDVPAAKTTSAILHSSPTLNKNTTEKYQINYEAAWSDHKTRCQSQP